MVLRRAAAEIPALFFDSLGWEGGLRGIPSLYIKLSRDRAFGPTLQDRAARRLRPDRAAILDSGHLPMLSRPAELAHLINSLP